ncbi:hypothetical protein R5L33_20420, partial [Acinetobacter baumannii]|nr:hypothetical protein [Acinetobacter baumannii]
NKSGRQLLVLDPDVFGRSIDDIEDQLDLMSLGNFNKSGRQLLVLDPDVFGRSIDDIEDQLDLMSLGN